MRVLVTGGAGFIGSHVAETLALRGDEVTVVDDLSSGRLANVPKGVRFERGDVRDSRFVTALFRDVRPEAVSHQAAQASVSVSVREPERDAQVNVLGTMVVAKAAAELGARLVFASTGGAIYGEVPEPRVAKPGDPTLPESPYAASKLSAEIFLEVFAKLYGLRYTVLRYANVYGPRQDSEGEAGVVAIFLGRLLRGEPVSVFGMSKSGDAGCIRDYTYVSDVVRANLAAIDGALDVRILNVGTGIGTATEQLAQLLVGAVGSGQLQYGEPRKGDLQRSVLDASEFSSRFGTPRSLHEGLALTAEYWRELLGQRGTTA